MKKKEYKKPMILAQNTHALFPVIIEAAEAAIVVGSAVVAAAALVKNNDINRCQTISNREIIGLCV